MPDLYSGEGGWLKAMTHFGFISSHSFWTPHDSREEEKNSTSHKKRQYYSPKQLLKFVGEAYITWKRRKSLGLCASVLNLTPALLWIPWSSEDRLEEEGRWVMGSQKTPSVKEGRESRRHPSASDHVARTHSLLARTPPLSATRPTGAGFARESQSSDSLPRRFQHSHLVKDSDTFT